MPAPRLDMALRVTARNWTVFRKSWKRMLLPSALDPIFYFLALGYGLGAYVSKVGGLSFPVFLAPALCVTSGSWGATFEGLFSVWRRCFESRIHDNILTTPVEAEDVVLGELLWAGVRCVLYGMCFLLVVVVLGYVDSYSALAVPAYLFVGGIIFGAMAMIFTLAISRSDYFTYYLMLIFNPLYLFGGVFFPVDALPRWAEIAAWCLPMLHLVRISRMLCTGDIDATLLAVDTGWLLVAAVLLSSIPLWQLRRRLIP